MSTCRCELGYPAVLQSFHFTQLEHYFEELALSNAAAAVILKYEGRMSLEYASNCCITYLYEIITRGSILNSTDTKRRIDL